MSTRFLSFVPAAWACALISAAAIAAPPAPIATFTPHSDPLSASVRSDAHGARAPLSGLAGGTVTPIGRTGGKTARRKRQAG